jgi:hypothetical protein
MLIAFSLFTKPISTCLFTVGKLSRPRRKPYVASLLYYYWQDKQGNRHFKFHGSFLLYDRIQFRSVPFYSDSPTTIIGTIDADLIGSRRWNLAERKVNIFNSISVNTVKGSVPFVSSACGLIQWFRKGDWSRIGVWSK